jgi:hypothetical protein
MKLLDFACVHVQMGLALLTSVLTSVPAAAMPEEPLRDLVTMLGALGPLDLVDSPEQRAERELNISKLDAKAFCTSRMSTDLNAPHHVLQVF